MALKLMAEIGLDGAGFHRGLSALNRSVSSWSSSLSARLGAVFSVAAITQFSRRTLEFADQLDKTASRLGVGVDKLQEWQFAAKQAGASAETLQTAIERLTLAAADQKNLPVFQKMGINPTGMNPEQLFSGVNKWAQTQSGPDVTRVLAQLVGTRQAGSLTNVVRSDLEALGAQARRLGAVMDQNTVAALSKISDQLSIVSTVLMSDFAPALLKAAYIALTAFQLLKGSKGFSQSFNKDFSTRWKRDLAWYDKVNPFALWWISTKSAGKASVEGAPAMDKAFEELAVIIAKLEALGGNKPLPSVIIPEAMGGNPAKRQQSSDALLEVGNFLGQRNGTLERINDRILKTNQEMVMQQKITNQKLDNLKPSADTIGVPLS